MKHYALIIGCFIAMHMLNSSATGQIILTSANTPKAEYKYTSKVIQFNYPDLFHAGADTVWDISNAVFTGDTTTTHYTQDTAFDPFPNCGMTNELHDSLNNLDSSFIQGIGMVYQITDTAYMVAFEGRDQNNPYYPCYVTKDKPYPIMSFPFGYGSINERHGNMQEKIIEWQKEGDAWGTLICPDTTYQNVLRIKTTDSIHYQPVPNHPSSAGGSSVTYQWYTADSDVPVFSLRYYYSYYWYDDINYLSRDTAASLLKTIEYIPIDTLVIVPRPEIVVFPNPATNTITIEATYNISELVIYNTSGYAVMHFSQITAGKKVSVNISTLSKGLYIAAGKFTSGAGFNKKFIVTED